MPIYSGYVIPESRVGGTIGVFYTSAVERVESSNRPLPSSKMKTNTVGNSVPEIRAIGVKYYPCICKNGLLGEAQGIMIAMGESPFPPRSQQTAKISNATYRINGRPGSAIVRCRGVVSGIPFFASICTTIEYAIRGDKCMLVPFIV